MKKDRAPDAFATGDLTCPCGVFEFTVFEVLMTGKYQKKCPSCGRLLEIIEENPNWIPEL